MNGVNCGSHWLTASVSVSRETVAKGLLFSMRSLARRSLEVATSCMALVICMVLSTLLMRSLMAFMDDPAMQIPPYCLVFRKSLVKPSSAAFSLPSVSGDSRPVSRMASSTSPCWAAMR